VVFDTNMASRHSLVSDGVNRFFGHVRPARDHDSRRPPGASIRRQGWLRQAEFVTEYAINQFNPRLRARSSPYVFFWRAALLVVLHFTQTLRVSAGDDARPGKRIPLAERSEPSNPEG